MPEVDVDERLRRAITRMVRRGIRLSEKKRRAITLARSSAAVPIDIRDLNPDTPAGSARLEGMLRGKTNYYLFDGLGELEEKNRIHWTALNRPLFKRTVLSAIVLSAMVLRAGRLKNRLYRLAGASVGASTEIMQTAWLDHFCPELIVIGDHSLIGAFCKVSTHAYEGGGKLRVALVKIGNRCVVGSGVALAAIRLGDGVKILAGTPLGPHFARIHPGSIVGGHPPIVNRAGPKPPKGEAAEGEKNNNKKF